MQTKNQRDRTHPYLRQEPYLIAIDSETSGLDWDRGDFPFIATASNHAEDQLFQLAEHPEGGDYKKGRRDLRKTILGSDGLILFNAPFDLHMLAADGICTLDEMLSKPIHDCSLLARIVLAEGNIQGKHKGGMGLKELACHYISADAGLPEQRIRECMKTMGLIRKVDQRDVGAGAYLQVWYAFRQEMEEYATLDTRSTFDLFHVLRDMATPDHLACYELERAVQPTLIRAEHRGIALNAARVDELFDEYTDRQDLLVAELAHMNGGEPFNPDGDKDVVAFLERNGVVIKERTESGQVKTDRWTLERYSNVPAVSKLVDYRRTAKFLSTYIGPMKDVEVAHPSFWQIGAWTGRMSCSRPNLQNIPVRGGAELRSMFVPRPGYALIVADYGSIEFRLLAYYMNDPALWERIESGDVFEWMGSQIYGTTDQTAWPVTRSAIKNGSYAILYGAGGPRLAQTIGGGMTADQGRALAKAIKDTLGPRFARLNARVRAAVSERGYVRTIGRRIQRIDAQKSYVALNALIQGSAADLMKVGMARAERALAVWDAYPLLVVHDELVAEVPTADAEPALHDMRKAMESAADLDSTGNLRLTTSGAICHNDYSEAK